MGPLNCIRAKDYALFRAYFQASYIQLRLERSFLQRTYGVYNIRNGLKLEMPCSILIGNDLHSTISTLIGNDLHQIQVLCVALYWRAKPYFLSFGNVWRKYYDANKHRVVLKLWKPTPLPPPVKEKLTKKWIKLKIFLLAAPIAINLIYKCKLSLFCVYITLDIMTYK